MYIINPYIFSSGYTIENALMFDGSADYLSWTPSSTASSNTDKTISFWVKRAKFGSVQWILDVASNGDQIQYTSGDALEVSLNATTDSHYTTKALFRDPTAWTHIVIAFDTDSDTAANKKRLWINGVLQADAVLDNHDDPADDANVDWMKASIAHNLGRRGNNSQFFAGYLAEFIGVDGTAYEASDFGKYDSKGIWVPVKPPTSLGNNGFHLDFKSADIGNDAAGSNNWTAVSSGPNNVVVDSCTDDSSKEVTLYPALDGINTTHQQGTLSNNNKTMTVSSGNWSGYRINMPVTSGGKIYFEFVTASDLGQGAGLTTIVGNIDQPGGGSPYVGKTGNYSMQLQSGFWTPGNAVNVPTGHETGGHASYYKCAYDDSNGKLWFGDADGWYGSSVSDSDVANGDDNTYTVAADDRGGKLFIYCSGYTNGGNTTLRLLSTEWSSSAPSGFSALTETASSVGNYWTLNPLASTDTLTNGNLSFTAAANFTTYVTAPAIPMSGKWYYEVTAIGGDQAIGTSASYDAYLGLVRTDVAIPTGSHTSNDNLWVIANWNPTPSGQKENGSSAGGSYAPTSGFGDGSIIMVAIDMDNNAMWFGNDGTWAGSATASEIANGTTTNAAFTNSSNNSFGSNQMMPYHGAHSDKATYNFGATAFAYTPPTGFKALNTANLPAPTVTPSEFFQVLDHTHDGSSSTFTLNWDPTVHDTMIMFKDQDDDSTNWYYSQTLYLGLQYPKTWPNLIAGSSQDTNFVSVSGTTITVGSTLPSSDYAVYCWRFGQISSRVSNSVGGAVQIASTTSVASHGGAGLCLYEGVSGASDSVAKVLTHGMGSSGIGWFVYENWEQAHTPIYMHSGRSNRNTHTMSPATGAAESNQSGYLFGGGSYPTGATLSCGSQLITDGAGKDLILWMFNEVEGFIDIGVYTGTGDASGPVIQTGFPPALIIIRRSDSSTTWVWRDNLRSPFNPSDENLATNLSDNEDAAGGDIDFLANGFRPVENEATVNASGGTYEYIAFASQPFGGDGVAQTKAR